MSAASVLIVEDEILLSSVYDTVLSFNNFIVETACDGIDALSKLATFTPHIILLDLLMPNMGGLEFLKEFNWAAQPNTKIIVYSNLFDGSTVDQVKSLGAEDIVLKSSLSPNQLVDLVNSHVGSHV